MLIDKDTEIHCATGVDVGMEEGWDKLQFWRIEGVVYFESYLAFIEASLVLGVPTFPGMPNSQRSIFVVSHQCHQCLDWHRSERDGPPSSGSAPWTIVHLFQLSVYAGGSTDQGL